ncbi:MAG: MFS transporter [Chloroflexi bacterium]|nr:MFS transporter [Chloroflexota bacterium]
MSDHNRRWLALGLVCLASLMIVLDATIVNVALPAIQQDLGFAQADLAWVVNAYLLTFGGCMLIAGRTADLLGRRRVLMGGIALFTGASLACGLASSQTFIVIARAIQGIGGATVSAVSLSIVLVLFTEQADRAKAMSIWGFVGSGGGTVGVIAGGLLTQSLNWHWIFLINVPIGALALVLARPLLPEVRGAGLGRGLDLGGAVGVVAAPMLAVYGMVNASREGWTSTPTVGCLLAAVAIAAALTWHEARTPEPLVPVTIFRSRTVMVSCIVIALNGAAFFGWFFFSPLYAQHILGFDALQTGLTFLPATLTMGAMSLGVAAWIVARAGPTRPLVAGMVLFALGLLLFARAPIDGTFVPDIALPMFLLGLGAGISFMPLFLIATNEVSPTESGLVSGTISTAQMIGGAIGLALLAGVAAARTTSLSAQDAPPLEALNDGYHLAFLVAAVLALSTAVLSAWKLRSPRTTRRRSRSRPAPVAEPELVGAPRS